MSSTVSAGSAAAAASSSSSSSSRTGPRDAAAEDDEDAVEDKEYTQPPTNDDDDDKDVATLIEHYVTSTAALQVKWDSLSGPQQQQIIRVSRSILVNNEEDEEEEDEEEEEEDEDEDEFYDAQEYEQGDKRTVRVNDTTAAADDHHRANNNDAAVVELATAGLANEDDAGPVPPAPASPPIDDNNADDDDDLPPWPPNDDAPTPVQPPNAVVDNLDNAAAADDDDDDDDDDDHDELPPPPKDPAAAAAAAVIPAEETPAVAGGNAADAASAAVSTVDDDGFDAERHTGRCGTPIRRCVRYLQGVVVHRLRRLTGRPNALLQRAVQGRKQYHSNGSTNTTIRRSGAVCCGSFLHAIVQLPPKPFFTYTDKTARVVLTTVGAGFDPDNLNERANGGWTPLLWFIVQGNVAMVRYLISRGADGRQTDVHGLFPMFLAALVGCLEIMKLLSRDGGAHEDIRRLFQGNHLPLYAAFARRHFHVVQWLILNEALSSPRNDAAGDGIDDALMRRDLRQYSACAKWDYDHRQTVLTWARDAVKTHDNVVKLPMTKLNGDVLKRIADYVVGTPKQVRTLRQFVDRLTVFIADEPFVE